MPSAAPRSETTTMTDLAGVVAYAGEVVRTAEPNAVVVPRSAAAPAKSPRRETAA